MSSNKTKNQAIEGGLGEVGEAVKKGRVRYQGGGNVIQGGGIGSTTFWLGDLGTFVSDREEGGGHIHGFSEADHGEVVTAEFRMEVGDS